MAWREPLILPCAFFGAGILTDRCFPFTPAEAATYAAICLLLALPATLVRAFSLLTATFFAGCIAQSLHPFQTAPRLSVPDATTATFEGCIVDPGLTGGERERFTVQIAPGARANVSLYTKSGTDFPALPYGSLVSFEGKARQPHNFNNPGLFDYVHYLARRQVYWTISAPASGIRILPGSCGNWFDRALFSLRGTALERIDRLYKSDDYATGMMEAVLIGVTTKLDKIWTTDYKSTGTFHALVISGSHVAVLAAVLLFFLRICAAPTGFAIMLTVIVAWLYAGITGWQAPVLRSAAGMTLYGIARIFYREGRVLNILAAVAILFLAFDPEQLFDASFQLSFLAVALIGAFAIPALEATSAPLARGLTDLNEPAKDLRLEPQVAQFRIELRLLATTCELLFRIPRSIARFTIAAIARATLYLWEIFVTSLCIQIGLALPMIVYFHRLPVSGLTANAIVVPALSALVPTGFLSIAFQSASLAKVSTWLLHIARAAVQFHAQWEPGWRIPSPPWWLAGIFVFYLIAAALRTRLWLRACAATAAIATLAIIVVHPFEPSIIPHTLELTTIDVGQGDSLLAAFPTGKLMLIDAGGIPSFGSARTPGIDIGDDVVSPYLWSRSITHLDVVAMTHAHTDHMGGMPAILRNFRPKELWIGAAGDSPEWRTVRDTARILNIRVRSMQRSPAFAWGGAQITVLAPGTDYVALKEPRNNDSLVMRLAFGTTSFLLTGDMEKPIERELLGDGLLSRTDVLKVGHHGSRTSSTPEFLDAVHPVFGLISDGFENSYGHPHPLTLNALRDHRTTIYRTDQNGAVTVTSNGRKLTVDSFR